MAAEVETIGEAPSAAEGSVLPEAEATHEEQGTGSKEEDEGHKDQATIRAQRSLNPSAAKAPEYQVWSLVDLGVTCRTVGNIEVAQDKFRAALAIDPASVRTLSHFGCFLHTACVDYDGAAEMYERALEIDPNHILTLCCYADMLSNSSNPRRDDERADRMMALAASKAANDSQRACVAFSRKNIQAARQREKDAREAREQYKLKVEAEYAEYTLAKNAKGKGKKKK